MALLERKKTVGFLVGGLLALIGALYGVDVGNLRGTITDQIETEIVQGELRMQLGDVAP